MSLYDQLGSILTCVQSELTAAGREIPADVFVSPGLPALDSQCGSLWARVVRIYRSDSFPEETTPSRVGCNSDLVAEIGVGITRCQSGVAKMETGGHPSDEQLSADADGLICDAGALLRGMVCCYPSVDDAVELVAGAWTQFEPDGGVVGGEWTAFIEADLYCETPSFESPGESP